MHTWIEINKSALLHNFEIFSKILGHRHVAPVLKSNAYGHGIETVYSILADKQPAFICVNYLYEGKLLRSLGYQARILVVGPAMPDELDEAAEIDAEIVIGNETLLQAWLSTRSKPNVHIKFDTGMSRQGFRPSRADHVLDSFAENFDLLAGVCTHFANVEDVTEHNYAQKQLNAFQEVCGTFDNAKPGILKHAASSASALILQESRFDLNRVGIALYGLWPSPATRLSYLQTFHQVEELRPVMSWYCRIATVKEIEKNQFVGYGCTFRAHRDMKIAVLPVGYFEGFPRIAGHHQSHVIIQGSRCPIIGRVCMNMMTVDVSHLSEVNVGEKVTLLGEVGGERITAEMIADWSQTIHYEIVSRINPSIPRRIT